MSFRSASQPAASQSVNMSYLMWGCIHVLLVLFKVMKVHCSEMGLDKLSHFLEKKKSKNFLLDPYELCNNTTHDKKIGSI